VKGQVPPKEARRACVRRVDDVHDGRRRSVRRGPAASRLNVVGRRVGGERREPAKEQQPKDGHGRDLPRTELHKKLAMPPTLVPTLALAALALATAAETADATTEPSTTDLVADAAAFKKAARPLIREYIFSDYASFAAGELTFRTLKTHLSEALGLPYDSMGTDEHAEVIESITDAVANRCDGGKLERERCMARFGHKPKDET
jgi:hypothetical protein